MMAVMLEDILCPSPHLLYNIWENFQTSEAYISKTFDLNDIRLGQ